MSDDPKRPQWQVRRVVGVDFGDGRRAHISAKVKDLDGPPPEPEDGVVLVTDILGVVTHWKRDEPAMPKKRLA